MKTKTEANREPWVKEYIKGDHFEDKVIIKSGDEWIATVSAEHIGTIWSAINGIRCAEKLANMVESAKLYILAKKLFHDEAVREAMKRLEAAIAKAEAPHA